MKDDAVAPVVAAMLILAIVVTFFAAWNAYFVPSMKAQSEITHIKDVESGFLRFSSDIDTAVSLKKSMKLSEQIPLGGGDFTFDPVKSGGELKVWNASPAGYMGLNWTSETEPTSPDHYSGLVKFSYKPVNNFWQDQGYGWSYGNVYVINSERNLSTPLKFANMDDVTYELAGSLVEMEPVPLYTSPGNCSSITVHAINIIPDSRHFRISGNGNGMLVLESNVSTERVLNATSMNLSITASPYGRFNTTLWDSLDTSVKKTLDSCGNVERTDPDPASREIRLTFKTYPYPNMTLIHETTEITIGAY
ncbi:MAG: hypothetical protein Q8N94_10315 [Methanoregula sp.]|nr:hypothetical protein [Methanoregula sp.]